MHTHCIPVVSTVKEIFDLTNVNAVVNLMAKQAVNVALSQSLAKARDQVRGLDTTLPYCPAPHGTSRTALYCTAWLGAALFLPYLLACLPGCSPLSCSSVP